MINNNKKYLITTRRFSAPDGLEYDSVWGRIRIINTEEFLGFATKGEDSGFVLQVSGDTKSLYVFGYQVECIMECEEKPISQKEMGERYNTRFISTYCM